MKTLIQKELRENVKLAVLGLFIFVLMLGLEYRDFLHAMKEMALGSTNLRGDILQPVIAPLLSLETGFFCAIFGAVLGWFQIHNERHCDLWAFLIHRPITRTGIFLGKIIGGLVLYALVAGLPLVCFIGWALAPGHVAAPFEWAMLQPVAVFFLLGIVCYFAGMLTGLRQARWYVSRAFGLSVAMIVFAMVVSAPHFWQVLVFILLGGAILATAVWGGFHSQGFFRGQPAAGKLALIGTLALGAVPVTVFAAFLLIFLLSQRTYRWPHYQMTKDGTIYRVTQETGKPVEIVDLDGKPLTDPKTGRPTELADFNRRICTLKQINPDFGDRSHSQQLFNRTDNLFTFWRATSDTLWYYWSRYGRLVGYDKATRRFIGSLGPDGFAKDLSGAGDRFDSKLNFSKAVQGRIINDARTVYEPDLEQRAIKTLFTVKNESCETALLATNANASRTTIGAVREVLLDGYDWNYTIVVTRCFVRLLTPDGRVVWQADYKPAYPDYYQVQVAFLESTNQFALWIGPSYRAQEKADGKLPTHVTWLDRDGRVLKIADLPELSRPHEFSREDKLISLSVPPALMVMPNIFDEEPWPAAIPWVLVQFSLMAALVCLPVGWWLGLRYSLSLPARLGWAAFYLVFGIPGLLTFLCVQEWPARESCPNCKKLRVVDREHCEHCGANFAPPQKNGTEIFEPLEMSRT
jgi:ABC-type transport system involved in multi-copper enzyme maturation permease subunit